MGPIPAGSTLSSSVQLARASKSPRLTRGATVFETELVGIQGVPKPESIKTKATGSVESKASSATEKVAEKVASKVAEAADVVKTIIADTDDTQEHNEL